MARFEYNSEKSKTNKERHGIDFDEARELWEGPHVIIPAKNVLGENRYAILGLVRKRVHMAIYTERGAGIRIISCNKADKRWVNLYEKSIKG